VRAEARSGLLLSTPYAAFLAAFLLLFALLPIGFSVVLVTLKWDLVTAPSFVGLDNVQPTPSCFWRSICRSRWSSR
jgi:ABC-type sugar transport system permease subunit